MILLIDNYDSFVYNLARYFQRLGQTTRVVRNDQISMEEISELELDAIVLSPGPCGPQESGICLDVVRQFQTAHPILGVCLGHQVIVEALGGNVVRSDNPVHGRASLIHHNSQRLFSHIPTPTSVARYHSLVVDESTMPAELCVTARMDDGTVMAIEHETYPVFGVQFHPESILTEHGFTILRNFLRLGNMLVDDSAVELNELVSRPNVRDMWPERPVTF